MPMDLLEAFPGLSSILAWPSLVATVPGFVALLSGRKILGVILICCGFAAIWLMAGLISMVGVVLRGFDVAFAWIWAITILYCLVVGAAVWPKARAND